MRSDCDSDVFGLRSFRIWMFGDVLNLVEGEVRGWVHAWGKAEAEEEEGSIVFGGCCAVECDWSKETHWSA